MICGKAVKQPFPLTNSEFHLSHLMNGNNLSVDNNFVMEWTFLPTVCPEYLVSPERVINSNRSLLAQEEGEHLREGLTASEDLRSDDPSEADKQGQVLWLKQKPAW